MNKLRAFIVVLFLVTLSGCSTEISDSFTPTKDNQVNQASTAVSAVLLSPGKLQISFVQNKATFAEFFVIDVGCLESSEPCFGEPALLFKTLSDSNNEPNNPSGRIRNYYWSPNGDKVILSANKDLFVGDMNTKEWENITNTPNVEEYGPKWSQDGKYIHYLECTQDNSGMGSCKLAQLDLADNTNTYLLNLINSSISAFAISPDNQSIVFSASASNGFERLYQSDLDGSNLKELTQTDREETLPSFSYDGLFVTFVRTNRPLMVANSESEADIIIQNIAWNNEKNLTDSFDGKAASPEYFFGGKWVVFEALDSDNHFNIYFVSLETGIIFNVTRGDDNKTLPSWRLFGKN
jgi:Tol biopolymer transport system component